MFYVFVGIEGAETGYKYYESQRKPVDFVLEWFDEDKITLSEDLYFTFFEIVYVEHEHVCIFVDELVGDGIGGVGGLGWDKGICVNNGIVV
jgi:hypothetical protein